MKKVIILMRANGSLSHVITSSWFASLRHQYGMCLAHI